MQADRDPTAGPAAVSPETRPDPILCGRCDYDVRGLPSTICPECGGDLRESGVIREPRNRSGELAALLVVAVVLGNMFAWPLSVLLGLAVAWLGLGGAEAVVVLSMLALNATLATLVWHTWRTAGHRPRRRITSARRADQP